MRFDDDCHELLPLDEKQNIPVKDRAYKFDDMIDKLKTIKMNIKRAMFYSCI